MSKEGIDRLELDAEHFKSYGLDSGALYNRIVEYLEELKERRSKAKSLEVKNGEKRQDMTDADLIAAMRRNSVETGSMPCLGCGYEHNCGIKGCAILRAAADSLESLSVSANKKVDDNPPLTLEELRGMDGEPVYLVFGTKKDGAQYEQWALVDAHTDDREINLVDGLGWNRTIQLDEEISGMRAYRRRPENEGRVVVLPCKMGEKIYINDSNGNTLELTAVNVAIVDSDGDANLLDWFGKTVFTSRAEAALKGAVENAD